MSAIYHNFRHHVKCVLTVPFGGSFKIVKTRWVTQTTRTFNYKSGKVNHTYNIDLTKAHYSNKNNPILTYSVEVTNPIDFSGKKGEGKSSNMYYTILMDKSGEEALNQSRNSSMLIVIGLLVIIIVGIGLYGQWQLSQANDKIILLTREMGNIIANMTKTGGVIIP